MKMYIEDDHGNIIECKELKSVGEGDLIVFLNIACLEEYAKRMERELSEKLNRNVVVLDSRVRDIMVVPPL